MNSRPNLLSFLYSSMLLFLLGMPIYSTVRWWLSSTPPIQRIHPDTIQDASDDISQVAALLLVEVMGPTAENSDEVPRAAVPAEKRRLEALSHLVVELSHQQNTKTSAAKTYGTNLALIVLAMAGLTVFSAVSAKQSKSWLADYNASNLGSQLDLDKEALLRDPKIKETLQILMYHLKQLDPLLDRLTRVRASGNRWLGSAKRVNTALTRVLSTASIKECDPNTLPDSHHRKAVAQLEEQRSKLNEEKARLAETIAREKNNYRQSLADRETALTSAEQAVSNERQRLAQQVQDAAARGRELAAQSTHLEERERHISSREGQVAKNLRRVEEILETTRATREQNEGHLLRIEAWAAQVGSETIAALRSQQA